MDRKKEVSISGESIQFGGDELQGASVARASEKGWTTVEFSIPTAGMNGLSFEPGTVYAFNVTSRDPDEIKSSRSYLDASWHGAKSGDDWGRLMIVK